jgi:hypothetical protein
MTAISIVSNWNNQFTMQITFKETAKIQNENPSAYKHKRAPTIYLRPESSPFSKPAKNEAGEKGCPLPPA